jgi:peptide/nickel transport system permease protein
VKTRFRARPSVWIAGLFLIGVIVACVAAPLIAPYGPQDGDLLSVLKGPSWHHLLGTDDLGRDVLSRLLYGGRITLLGAAEAVLTFIIIGLPLGLVAGYRGGRVDSFVMAATDVVLSIPVIILLLVVSAVARGNVWLMVTLGVIASPGLIRVVRASTLAVRAELYVKAAEVVGLSRMQIVRRHILPRIAGPAFVQVSVFAAAAVVIECSLGYLGLDVSPPAPSWGSMVAEGATQLQEQSWLIIPSGLTITLTVLAIGLVGDAVRDASSRGRTPVLSRRKRRRARGDDAVRPTSAPNVDSFLSVRDLEVSLGEQVMVDRVSFDLRAGEALGIVGESGSGKTLTVLALLGLLPAGLEVTGGNVVFDRNELNGANPRELAALRGREIGYISQDPMLALDPGWTVGNQLREAVRATTGVSRKAARSRVIDLLRLVELPDPETVSRRYPHELSGGMAQRVSIALALAGEPKLLVADEPTTALDVTVQAEILALLRSLREETGMALLIVTHDWGVVADACDETVVMYAGQIVETAPIEDLFDEPKHPYTEALLAANPHLASEGPFEAIPGSVPSPSEWPTGCRFRTRCRYAQEDCAAADGVALEEVGPTRAARCLHTDLVGAVLQR